MALRPEIFVSAVVPELSPYRIVVKHTLLELGARPMEHQDFSVEYGPLHGVLSEMISRCEAVIHLVGFDYGREPQERTLHAPRRSFAQYEVDVARLLGRPLFIFASTEAALPEGHLWEEDEKRTLQQQHRSALERGETLVPTFSSPQELARLIRGLRSRLIIRHSLTRLPARPMGARFIGRNRVLDELGRDLAPGRIDVLHPPSGGGFSGGQGKTCLAIELGWRLQDEGRFAFVFWMPAGPRADLEVSLAALARTDSLALLADEVVSHRARYQAVLHWFAQEENAGRWLMIIDGVDDEIAWWSLRTILPHLGRGAVLVTGCHQAWSGSYGHPLGCFGLEQAREFLAHRLERSGAASAQERQAWDRLAETLGRLPLALEVAAAFLRESKQTAREFLTEWTVAPRSPALAIGPSAVAMIEHAVAALDPSAASLLRTLSCLDAQPAAIPIALFEHRGDWPQNSAALQVLERRALIFHDESGQTVSMHRFIREIVRDRLPAEDLATALGAARVDLEAVLQRPTGAGQETGLRELLIPHCRALLGQLLGHPLELHASGIARALGDWLKNNGRLIEAENFYRRALAIEERRLGSEHPDLAPRLRDLIAILRTSRRLGEAEELSRRLIALHEQMPQQDLNLLAADVTQYAATLRAANRLEGAESLCRQALAITRQAVGPEHPKLATALHHLAGVLEAAHRPREAEPLYRRALTVEERAFGSTHPRLVSRLFHLAWVLAPLGKRVEAEALFRRGLAIDEEHLGSDHPDLAPALEALAGVLEDSGQLAAAEQVYRRSLHLHEKTLGPEHPETAMALTNLGGLLEERGEAEAARELYERSAGILYKQTRRLRGPHPNLNPALENLTRALRTLGVPEREIEVRLAGYRPIMPKRVRSKFLDD